MQVARVFLLSIGLCILCAAAARGDTLTGRVGLDLNSNGVLEATEPGVKGVTVQVRCAAGTIEGTAVTAADGTYQVDGLVSGWAYSVSVVPPAGCTVITRSPLPVTMWGTPTACFGLCCPGCLGRIGDYVWFDANNNGLQDDGDSGIPDVTVTLKDGNGNVVATTTTTPNPTTPDDPPAGYYQFTELCPGTYIVSVDESTLPGGLTWVRSPCLVGMDRAVDNNCSPYTVVLTPDNPNDDTIDFGYYHQPGEDICMQDPSNPGGTMTLGTLTVNFVNGDVVVVFRESTALNDNSYGTNTVSWPRNHNFSDLVGSDKAEFRLTDKSGKVVFDFDCDYISTKSGTPSGYACLGATGGDGKVLVGQAAWLKAASTSLADNLNNWGYCVSGNCSGGGVNLLLNSPPTLARDSYDFPPGSPYTAWEFPIRYTVTISGQAFGATGIANFGGVTIPLVHNSPPKIGTNAASQIPCAGQSSPDCGACKGGVTQLTLQYQKATTAHVLVYNAAKYDKKPDPAKVLFEGDVSATDTNQGQFTFLGTGAGWKMNNPISIYVDGKLAVTIRTDCSQPIGPGLVIGDFKVIDGYSKDGGKLCAVTQ